MRKIKEDKEAVIELIEQKALDVFAIKGYKQTSMQDIANAVGLSRGPLYYHYKSKSDLYNHVANIFLNDTELKYKEIFCSDDNIFIKIHKDLMLCTLDSNLHFFRDIDLNKDTDIAVSEKRYIEVTHWLYKLKYDSIIKALQNKEIKKDTDPLIILDLMYLFYNGIAVMNLNKTICTDVSILVDFFVKGLKSEFEEK